MRTFSARLVDILMVDFSTTTLETRDGGRYEIDTVSTAGQDQGWIDCQCDDRVWRFRNDVVTASDGRITLDDVNGDSITLSVTKPVPIDSSDVSGATLKPASRRP